MISAGLIPIFADHYYHCSADQNVDLTFKKLTTYSQIHTLVSIGPSKAVKFHFWVEYFRPLSQSAITIKIDEKYLTG